MLEIDSLTARYGRAQILNGVSLTLGRNEVVALLGRNGAGKSTTMKSVMGLVRQTGGSIRLDGANILDRASHLICRAGIGYVPEDRRIFGELTVEENLEVGRRPAREGAPQWTTDHLFQLFPNLAERRQNLGKQLSGGEQQMLSIARTLMGNPSLVLLDEPSEGIAPVIVEQMANVISELKREGLSVLLSEQNLHFAREVSDRAYIIEKGTMRYEGDFADLDARPEVSAQYLAV
ncbi:ABC transporter ATP-binding protein [Ruegeria pomeroyi]|uniref:ABC transporter ATP-binding protein n=1 Tax=Ruegeria pomeroyi TaxID=89184 RepID=A0A9Q3ZQZ3_9RHOB|nr:ABC transporter ATP-binding protein [Ruegeria pomeroyi]MCE8539624.1 ABC transporter ATP-binding protein [Ruegeria pomeroyi]